MTEDEVKLLLKRYLEGTCTPLESKQLEAWMDHEAEHSEWSWGNERHKQIVKQRIAGKVRWRVTKQKFGNTRKFIVRKTVIAASLFFALASMVYLFFDRTDRSTIQTYVIELPQQQPKGPILTLSNGTKIRLRDMKDVEIDNESGSSIKKIDHNVLMYESKEVNEVFVKKLNTLQIPAGENYQLVLPDGSRVWLNACSQLSFPNSFDHNQRQVYLKGEAYFEVKHLTNIPFKVEANGTNILVKGTHFNVSAYEDDTEVVTTLVEGSVEVSNSQEKTLLEPNQQATVNRRNNTIAKHWVDLDIALAWKNDYFIFDDLDIKTIMHQISRWYNVSVTFQQGIPEKKFGGTFSRSKSIEDLLTYLAKLGNIQFKLEDANAQKERRVIVIP